MFQKPDNLKNVWLDYIELYEDLKQKSIPEELKILTKDIRDILKTDVENNKSFIKYIDLHNFKFNLQVIFNIGDNKTYFSDVNVYDVIYNDVVNLKINIIDNVIHMNDLMSVINHELRHVYDILNVNDDYNMKSFLDLLNFISFKNDNNIDPKFKYFNWLIYISFEHELIARNCMIYDKFIGVNKSTIYDLFKKSKIYEELMNLENFNSMKFIIGFNLQELIDLTNKFNDKMKNNYKVDKDNIFNYYKKWEEFFKQKSKEYLQEAYKMIDIVIQNEINENQIFKPYDKYPSYKEVKYNTVFKIYQHIYKTLI